MITLTSFRKILLVSLGLVLLLGCEATKVLVEKKYQKIGADTIGFQIENGNIVSEQGLDIFEKRLEEQLTELKIFAENGTHLLEIHFDNYYMRHGAARALGGIFAGTDNITSLVTVTEVSSGEILASFKVVSKNSSAWGSSKGLIEDHADKIVKQLSP